MNFLYEFKWGFEWGIYIHRTLIVYVLSMLVRKGEADCGWAGVWMDLERLLGWDKMEWTHDHNIIH